MSTNDVSITEDAEMAECDGDKVVTMLDVLQEQQNFEEDANAVLGASDDKNCTYPKGYIKRQALYACLTCCTEAKYDSTKRAGVCLACSLTCHENHELVELYTKRNFRCDCGNPKFNLHPCQFTPSKTELNGDNIYNQNFSGLYCVCHRPYPDPDATFEDDMIQCIICEDWLHASHLEAAVPPNEQYAEMICKSCMEKNEFLHDYTGITVYAEIGDVDILTINGNDSSVCNGDLGKETTISITDVTSTAEKEVNDTDVEMTEGTVGNGDVQLECNIDTKSVEGTDPAKEKLTNDNTDMEITEGKVETYERAENEEAKAVENVKSATVSEEHKDVSSIETGIAKPDDECNNTENENNKIDLDNENQNVEQSEQTIEQMATGGDESVEQKKDEASAHTIAEKINDENSTDAEKPTKDDTNTEEKADPESVSKEQLESDAKTESEHETEPKKGIEVDTKKKTEQTTDEQNNDTPGSEKMDIKNDNEFEKENIAFEQSTEQKSDHTMDEQGDRPDNKESEIEDDDNSKKDNAEQSTIENSEVDSAKQLTDEQQKTELTEEDFTGSCKEKTEDEKLLDDLNELTSDKPNLEETSFLENKLEESLEETAKLHDDTVKSEEAMAENKAVEKTSASEEKETVESTIGVTDNKKTPDTSHNASETDKTDAVMNAIDEILEGTSETKSETPLENSKTDITENNSIINDLEMREDIKSSNEVPKNTESLNAETEAKIDDELSANSEIKDKIEKYIVETKKTESETETSVSNEPPADKDTKSEITNTEIPKDDNSSTKETIKSDDSKKVTEDKENATNKPESNENVPILTESTRENKRKLDTESEDISAKKAKLDEAKPCIRPKEVKRVFKGATFWPSNFRQKLCTCGVCISMYNDLNVLFLTDAEDTVTAYERLGKENIGGSQYEKGLEALSSLDRIQQINALTEYNKMRDKLLDFLKSFKDKKEIVKEEDIKAFFAGMKPRREPDGVYFCR